MCWIFFLSLFFSSLYAENSFLQFPSMTLNYHPVSTQNPEAQKAFDEGLLGIYAFNYDAALANFEKVIKLDPELAMGYWGMAMALDQNLDSYVRPVHARLTMYLLKKAQEFAPKATDNERAYIKALEKRFSEDNTLDRATLRKAYSVAMKELCKAFPDDIDAQVLCAESLMDTLYWELWEKDKPRKGTEEILTLLEQALIVNPMHLGANHYYIHAVEFSPYPERGLMSAERIDAQNPNWGHLLHTTSHIYLRVGAFEKARLANKRAVNADLQYIQKQGIVGKYPVHFLSHNYFFLTIATMWLENYPEAIESATTLAQFIQPHIQDMPAFETAMTMPLQVYLYFHKWEEILNYPAVDKSLGLTNAFRLFARAMAYTHLGKQEAAEQEKSRFQPEDSDILAVAELVLEATMAKARKDFSSSEALYKKAIEKQDLINFTNWYQPIRQNLGALLLEQGKAKEAEGVFREALKRLPLHPRSLFGLTEALKAQKKFSYWSERETREALKFSNTTLTLDKI